MKSLRHQIAEHWNSDCLEKYLINNELLYFKDFEIAKKSYLKVGGVCSFFVQPSSINQLTDLIVFLRSHNIPFKIIGNLTNIIFQGTRIQTTIISTRKIHRYKFTDNQTFYAETGAMLPHMAGLLSRHGYGGYSGLVGIPGTIGGAVFMNAGAYGCQISENLKYATCLNDRNEICELSKEELSFSWRNSAFQGALNKYIILSAVFTLIPGDSKSLQEHIKKVAIHRKTYLESKYPNLGSTFATKNIYGDLSKYYFFYRLVHVAAKIITKIYLGDKNYFYARWMNQFTQKYFDLKATANVAFSDKTFNCIINKGGASADEIIEFITRIQQVTKNRLPLEIEIFRDKVGSTDR